MNYTIIAYDSPTDKVGRVIFDTRRGRLISAGKLSLKDVDVDSMDLTVNQASPLYRHVQPMQTHFEVKQDGKLIFRGRALKPSRSMSEEGAFSQSFSSESVEAYLMDSRQRQGEYHNISPKDFLAHLLAVHNAAVPAHKQFKLGNVTVTDPNNSIYRYTGYDTTWQTINDKLIEPLGGYLRVRIETGGMYLDYLATVGKEHPNDNPIKLGRNLKSATVDIDPTKIITRVIPLGATIQTEAESTDANGTQPRVTIASVNDGKDYIDIPELQSEFGVIEGTAEWDDVNDPAILLAKVKVWIKEQAAATQSWQINALELGEGRFTWFTVSDSYRFIAKKINPQTMLRVTQKDIDFLHPRTSALTIGDKSLTLTAYQRQNRAEQRNALQLAQNASAGVTQLSEAAKETTKALDTVSKSINKAQEQIDNQDYSGLSGKIETIGNQVDSAMKNITEIGQEVYANTQNIIAIKEQLNNGAGEVTAPEGGK